MPVPQDLTLGKYQTAFTCEDKHAIYFLAYAINPAPGSICRECGKPLKPCTVVGDHLDTVKGKFLWFSDNYQKIVYRWDRWR